MSLSSAVLMYSEQISLTVRIFPQFGGGMHQFPRVKSHLLNERDQQRAAAEVRSVIKGGREPKVFSLLQVKMFLMRDSFHAELDSDWHPSSAQRWLFLGYLPLGEHKLIFAAAPSSFLTAVVKVMSRGGSHLGE